MPIQMPVGISFIEKGLADDHDVVGKVGRVTGAIAPGTVGEVMIPVRGGVESFYAYPADGSETIALGERVVVIDYEPPRSVTVSKFT
jgi:hypothetical protein